MAVAPHRPALASSRVLHVGEPVAMVVAVSAQAAQDAGEKIAVDYQPLTPVTDARAAIAPGAPQLWPEAPGNIAFDWTAPADPDGKKQAALDRAFQDAAHVVRVEARQPAAGGRLARAPQRDRELRSRQQAVHLALPDAGRRQYARPARRDSMNIKPEELRVLTDDVGGAFGMKGAAHPEYVALLHAARALGKPVHWLATRAEAFLSDCQGRELVLDGGTRAQSARPLPGAARERPRQHGRLYHAGRAFHRDLAYLRLPADGLRHPACAGELALRIHQYAADRTVSRRRPAGGERSDRAR